MEIRTGLRPEVKMQRVMPHPEPIAWQTWHEPIADAGQVTTPNVADAFGRVWIVTFYDDRDPRVRQPVHAMIFGSEPHVEKQGLTMDYVPEARDVFEARWKYEATRSRSHPMPADAVVTEEATRPWIDVVTRTARWFLVTV